MASLSLFVSTPPGALAFELPGKPEAQPRPGFRGFGRYNPKRQILERTRATIKKLVQPLCRGDVPLFQRHRVLAVELVFHMPRPRSHISSSGGLLQKFQLKLEDCLPRRKVDVDNLCKFILDAMIGPVYLDDCQIVKLCCLKLNDDVGACEGRTEIKVTEIVNKNQLTLRN